MKLTSSDFCFPCTKCGCKFDSLRLVRKHNCETEEINISKKNTCDDRNILHKNQLKTIKDKPDQEKEKNILEEKIYVVSENNLKKDVRNVFKCELCYHTFINNASYTKHVQDHNKESFSCELCEPLDQTFSKQALVNHKFEVHDVEKNPFMCKTLNCDLCGYSTSQASKLSRHKMTHTGKKPYQCNSCNISCTTAGGLMKHSYTHSLTLERSLTNVAAVTTHSLQLVI